MNQWVDLFYYVLGFAQGLFLGYAIWGLRPKIKIRSDKEQR